MSATLSKLTGTFMTWTGGNGFHDMDVRLEHHVRALLGAYQQATMTPMLDWSQCSAVERVPGKVSGAWVFKGTRAPVRALFENLEGGAQRTTF